MTEFQHMAPLTDEEVDKIVDDQLLLFDREPEKFLTMLKLPLDTTRDRAWGHVRLLIDDRNQYEIWRNDTYQVAIYNKDEPQPGWPKMIHLSIKRIDREIIRDWRELQEIKNRLIGRENEAVEIFPAESRRVDMANQYHLFVLANPKLRFPFGFMDGYMADPIEGSMSKQRPLNETKVS